jgi:hypothetical protein
VESGFTEATICDLGIAEVKGFGAVTQNLHFGFTSVTDMAPAGLNIHYFLLRLKVSKA